MYMWTEINSELFTQGVDFDINTGINECMTGAASCAPDATCIDTLGSFECRCNEGFEGDGRTVCVGEFNARY